MAEGKEVREKYGGEINKGWNQTALRILIVLITNNEFGNYDKE
jgi:hypothetical protein